VLQHQYASSYNHTSAKAAEQIHADFSTPKIVWLAFSVWIVLVPTPAAPTPAPPDCAKGKVLTGAPWAAVATSLLLVLVLELVPELGMVIVAVLRMAASVVVVVFGGAVRFGTRTTGRGSVAGTPAHPMPAPAPAPTPPAHPLMVAECVADDAFAAKEGRGGGGSMSVGGIYPAPNTRGGNPCCRCGVFCRVDVAERPLWLSPF
jgi:hypothetical protein